MFWQPHECCMRRETLYLQDIIEACDLQKAAALKNLAGIGEAAPRLPQAFRETHPQVEWRDIIAFRNIAVHAYFAVQWDIVWATAHDDVPLLRRQVLEILQTEN